MPSVTLHPGTADLDYVETLLERNDFPFETSERARRTFTTRRPRAGGSESTVSNAMAPSAPPVGRAAAPDVIRDTTEFAALCPATATCMRKSL